MGAICPSPGARTGTAPFRIDKAPGILSPRTPQPRAANLGGYSAERHSRPLAAVEAVGEPFDALGDALDRLGDGALVRLDSLGGGEPGLVQALDLLFGRAHLAARLGQLVG